MSAALRYALISPVRDEAANLPRLAECIAAQTVPPTVWVIVDNGSSDGTLEVARRLEAIHPWVILLEAPGEPAPRRGAPIVRAFQAGLDVLDDRPDVVVKLDADLSMGADYFEQLLATFASEPRLGIASGTCWESVEGSWRPQHVTRNHVRGAARAYRRECLDDVLPLVERIGWDGIDELKAQTRGWTVRSLRDLRLDHHRSLGERDRRFAKWAEQGETAYFMGYRPSYLLVRALYRAARDPAALVMLVGYWRAVVRRIPRYDDPDVRRLLSDQQSLRKLPRRALEAFGRR